MQGCTIISTRLGRISHMYSTHACYELYQTSQVPFLIHWTELFVCWVLVAPQDIKHIESNQVFRVGMLKYTTRCICVHLNLPPNLRIKLCLDLSKALCPGLAMALPVVNFNDLLTRMHWDYGSDFLETFRITGNATNRSELKMKSFPCSTPSSRGGQDTLECNFFCWITSGSNRQAKQTFGSCMLIKTGSCGCTDLLSFYTRNLVTFSRSNWTSGMVIWFDMVLVEPRW